MSAADEAEMTAPRDPASYARPRRPGLGRAAFVALVVLAVLVGWLLGVLGPKPFTMRAEAPEPAPAAEPAPAISQPMAAAPADPAPSAAQPAPAELGAVGERLAALEQEQARTSGAAAAALAAAALMEASRGTGGFADELAALRTLAPNLPELAALEPLARAGAPSRSALADSFPDYAARAAVASRAPGEGASLLERVGHAFSRIVTLRRVGEVPGEGPDALIARAERQLEDGQVDRAVRTLYGLPSAGREALGPWLARAERRAEIDRRVAALRAQALAQLAAAARPPPAGAAS
ncbi:COG4223 family protein [Phenylobacterium terrae]|uniref:COG4223 family protein n=1 Tax=Phenylobacterium terrae TaxID=2665495 RepID=UPI0036216976